MGIYRVTEYVGTITGTKNDFVNLESLNNDVADGFRNDLDENSWSNIFNGFPGAVLGIVAVAAQSTVASLSLAFSQIIDELQTAEKTSQAAVIEDGAQALQNIVGQFNSTFSQVEVQVSFLEFELDNGSKYRVVQGNDYVVQRALTPSGWIDL